MSHLWGQASVRMRLARASTILRFMSSGSPPPTDPPRRTAIPRTPQPIAPPLEVIAEARRRGSPALPILAAVVLAGAVVGCAEGDGSTSISTEAPVVTTTAAPQTTTAVIPQPTTSGSPQLITTIASLPTSPVTSPPTTIVGVEPTTAATPPPTTGPHGVAVDSRCVRPDIDFAAVREAPGVTQVQVGEIPPSTCDVQVYATGTDGRIAWLEVSFGDVFGWSAESNFV
jgi:hypothetical protein